MMTRMHRVDARPPAPPPARGLPIGLFVALGAVVVVGLFAVAGWLLVGRSGAGPFASTARWSPRPPILRDVTGDGVDDLLGEASTNHLVLLDGRTGKAIWEKDLVYPASGHVFVGDHLAILRDRIVELHDVRTGALLREAKPAWQDKPGSVVACDGQLFAVAIDDTASRIDPKTAATQPAKLPAACVHNRTPLWSEVERPCRWPRATCTQDRTGTYGRYTTTLREEPSGRVVRITFKEKGTDIATATRDDGASVVVAPEGGLQGADVSGDWIVVARGREVFAYDFATKRAWAAPLPTELKTGDYDHGWLRVANGRVYANTSSRRRGASGELVVLDLATGRRLWK